MRTPTWVLGYHGCEKKVGEAVLRGETTLRPSENDWDWLGTGIYFWENSSRRAHEWAAGTPTPSARERKSEPFVIGAVIDLGECLNLLEAESIRFVQQAHKKLRQVLDTLGMPVPQNNGERPDRVIRRLDCAVINFAHELRATQSQQPFDSVRAAFVEGRPLYEGAGFHAHTHLQLCVRDEAQIIGYFRVR